MNSERIEAQQLREEALLQRSHGGDQRSAAELEATADGLEKIATEQERTKEAAWAFSLPSRHPCGFMLQGELKPDAKGTFQRDRSDLVSMDIVNDIGIGHRGEVRKGDTLIFAPTVLGPGSAPMFALVRFRDEPAASFFGQAYVNAKTLTLVSVDPAKHPIVRNLEDVTVAWQLVELRRSDVRLI